MSAMSVAEVRRNIGDVLDRAEFQKNRLIVTKNGKPVAAIVPIEDLEKLEAQAFDEAMSLLHAKYGRALKKLAE
ncbi:MAG: type II toxin-antitoxin system prevent-host-death family antitoxin [Cyanobacteria bacterium REEB65]|nr:type II toxin-antitoxin system prevent-host-death family antitoxin [Cyanobacteria bacterium REEB65]